jgi:hypothetical protein
MRITPLNDLDEAVTAVRASGHIHEKWFYPPRQFNSYGGNESGPPVPTPWFELAATHQIEDKTGFETTEFLEFMILLFGWSQGLLLYPEGWGHHYRVATEVGMLTDFRIRDIDIETFLKLGEAFWLNHHESGAATGLFAAVHWYLYSCSYRQQFERFMNQYKVLDTCFSVYLAMHGIKKKKPCFHFDRAKFLCEKMGLQIPSWAESITKKGRQTSPLAEIRNELVHEAKWAGAPIGFACLSGEYQNILLELKNFNCRLISALLGISGAYVSSSSQTRHPRHLKF